MKAEALKTAREEAGLSMADAAKLAGCSRSYLWEMENGKTKQRPSAELLFNLSELYGARLSWLLGKRERDGSPVFDAVPPALREMAAEHGLSETEIHGLAQQSHRGQKPKTKEDYWFIWYAVGLCCR
jgi:transcriptional regulator with XRE-family HTH domain